MAPSVDDIHADDHNAQSVALQDGVYDLLHALSHLQALAEETGHHDLARRFSATVDSLAGSVPSTWNQAA